MEQEAISYSLKLEKDVLWIQYHPLCPQKNTQIVQSLTQQLDDLITKGLLCGGSLLKINGKHSIPMAYVLAHVVSHRYGAIALFEPETNQYIVAISHNPDYPLGTCLV